MVSQRHIRPRLLRALFCLIAFGVLASTTAFPQRAERITLEGQAVYASPADKWEAGSANGVQIALLDAVTHKTVATVKTDDKGQFAFVNTPPGRYKLVASAGELQVISFPLQLTAGTSKRLLLHLREKQDKRKAFVTAVRYPALRQELLSMYERDQAIRNEMIRGGVDHPSKDVMTRMDAIDREDTSRVKSIIARYGWPSSTLVGWDGTEAAFYLVQHADRVTHRKLLPLIEKEFRTGNLSGPNYALFVDRALVEEGKPQIYGARAKPFNEWKGGEPVLYPIRDEANVDKRRAKVGLGPLAEYLKTLKRMYHPTDNE